MYKLYYLPGTCSLAIHTILLELGQPFELIKKSDVTNYYEINPAGTVPVLVDGDLTLTEGASIVLHLMEKHPNAMWNQGHNRAKSINWLMFANATMHPGYGKMFFASANVSEEPARGKILVAGADKLTNLWQIVDQQLAKTSFVGGDSISPTDILLTVYANWGQYFKQPIALGANVTRMLKAVSSRPSFQKALTAEGMTYTAVA